MIGCELGTKDNTIAVFNLCFALYQGLKCIGLASSAWVHLQLAPSSDTTRPPLVWHRLNFETGL
ncbi:unnamed protein product [Ixodes persulcatus]